MHITFMRLMGLFAVGLGCYTVLSLAIPNLRPRNWQDQPTRLIMLGACFCVLLGLWAFGVARPYTWIAAIVVWGVAFLIQQSARRKSGATTHDSDN